MKWFLAIVFLMYGIPKFFISQFTTTPELIAQKGIGYEIAWPFFGYSRIYEYFIAFGEVMEQQY